MSDLQELTINGVITVTKGIRHDGLWSVSCIYRSNTGRGTLQHDFVNASLMAAMNEFNTSWIQFVIDFEAGP